MRRQPFLISDIHIGSRHRQPDAARVTELAKSIRDVGLMNPPAVCLRDGVVMPDGEVCDGVAVLIYGRHRLLALQENGDEYAECVVHEVDDLHAELMEIDENLQRAELSPAEEAAHIARRKAIWEEIHGPAKAIGARAANAAMGKGDDATENSSVAFTTDTAAASGKTDRTIRMAAARGRELGPDIQRIVGTSLDKGVEMDALIKLPEQERAELIGRAEAGEQVTARPDPSLQDRKAQQRDRYWKMWASLDDDVRQEILAAHGMLRAA